MSNLSPIHAIFAPPGKILPIAGLGAALIIGGCQNELATCRQKGDVVHVPRDGSCTLNFGGSDARYVVMVTQQPYFGEARGQGKYLKYSAKRGFTGEDRLTIKVERRGIGHVQWQTQVVKMRVGLAG